MSAGLCPDADDGSTWRVFVWHRAMLTRTTTCGVPAADAVQLIKAAWEAAALEAPVYMSAYSGSAGHGAQRRLAALELHEAVSVILSAVPRACRMLDCHSPVPIVEFPEEVERLFLSPTPVASGRKAAAQQWSCADLDWQCGSRPQPLHAPTAAAVGLAGGAVPDLAAAVLGDGAKVADRRRIQALLLRPPTDSTARSIHDAIQCVQCRTTRLCQALCESRIALQLGCAAPRVHSTESHENDAYLSSVH